MKIRGATVPAGYLFSRLDTGDVFMWQGDLYIKAAFTEYNAVELKTGAVFFLDDGDKVVPVNGEFVIT